MPSVQSKGDEHGSKSVRSVTPTDREGSSEATIGEKRESSKALNWPLRVRHVTPIVRLTRNGAGALRGQGITFQAALYLLRLEGANTAPEALVSTAVDSIPRNEKRIFFVPSSGSGV